VQDLHVARRHQKTQEMTEDKILAVVSKVEEATAARVKKNFIFQILKSNIIILNHILMIEVHCYVSSRA